MARSLACNPDGFTGTPEFTFGALARLVAGRTGNTSDGGDHESVLLFAEPDSAELFMSELVEQAQHCADNPDEGAGDGTRYRWAVDQRPNGDVLLTLTEEFRESGEVWLPSAYGAEELMFFGRDSGMVVLAAGRSAAEGPVTSPELATQIKDVVDKALGR
jgi:hypothetical protein